MSPAPRRSIPVDVRGAVKPGARVYIRPVASTGGYVLSTGTGEVLAYCTSAKRLSDYAFEHGAFEVTSSFDWKIADDEP